MDLYGRNSIFLLWINLACIQQVNGEIVTSTVAKSCNPTKQFEFILSFVINLQLNSLWDIYSITFNKISLIVCTMFHFVILTLTVYFQHLRMILIVKTLFWNVGNLQVKFNLLNRRHITEPIKITIISSCSGSRRLAVQFWHPSAEILMWGRWLATLLAKINRQRCHTRGELQRMYITYASTKVVLKSRGDVSRNLKQGYQWPHKWTCVQQKLNFFTSS